MNILVVVVLYKTELAASQTIRRLTEALRDNPDLQQQLTVMIWDNSPDPLPDPQLPIPFLYRHTGANLGSSGAYNAAAQYAAQQGCTWLHLFDQDTAVTVPFLQAMLQHAAAVDPQSAIALIAPTVFVRGCVVSPREYIFNRHRAYPSGEIGIAPGEPFAINSGCMLRVAALQQVGGFSAEFWLDYSDIELSHRLHLHGFQLWRAADVRIEHDMTIMDYDRLMTPDRYRNYSAAESAFNDIYKGRMENASQTLRNLVRAVRQRFKYQNPQFSRIAWRQWIYRMRTSRAQRIARWKQDAANRLAQQNRSDPSSEGIKASDAA
jgi:GT2 family glycosyltransferase